LARLPSNSIAIRQSKTRIFQSFPWLHDVLCGSVGIDICDSNRNKIKEL